MKNKEVFVTKSFHSEDDVQQMRLSQTFLSTMKTSRNVLFHSHDWSVSGLKNIHRISEIETIQNLTFDAGKKIWDEWNQTFISLIRDYGEWLGLEKVPLSGLSRVLDEIPCSFTLHTRFKNMWYELGEDEDQSVSPKSLMCMLRFLPALEQKESQIGFFLDEETGRLGINISQRLNDEHRKTLDLVFNESGEVYFTFIEGGEGYSRISGSSYLTDYLVNSSKIHKLINIFDY